MSKAIKNVGKDIKAGFKNIPAMYKALYKADPRQKSIDTVKGNLRIIGTGKSHPGAENKHTPGTRARIAVAGVTSVTPIGPITAFALGVQKSKNARAEAKAAKPLVAPVLKPKSVTVKLPKTK